MRQKRADKYTSNGSQFFVTTVVTSWLDGKHVVFGKAKNDGESFKVIKSIEAVGSSSGTTKYDKREGEPTIVGCGEL